MVEGELKSSSKSSQNCEKAIPVYLYCIPATAVPSEQVFSACGLVINKLRCSLLPSHVIMIFLAKNKLPSTCIAMADQVAVPPGEDMFTCAADEGQEEAICLSPMLVSLESAESDQESD